MEEDVNQARDSQNWVEIDAGRVCSRLGEVATMETMLGLWKCTEQSSGSLLQIRWKKMSIKLETVKFCGIG